MPNIKIKPYSYLDSAYKRGIELGTPRPRYLQQILEERLTARAKPLSEEKA